MRQVYGQGQYRISNTDAIGRRVIDRYHAILKSEKTPVIVDAGANIGAASLVFASQFPRAVTVAVEPEDANFAVLVKNSGERIKPIKAAIGSTPGHVALGSHGLGWTTRTTRSDTGLPVVTMTQAFNSVENGTPFIAKIDIEGFEDDLFSTNTEWLNEVFVAYIEPHDWMLPGQHTSRTFQRAMAEHDFELFIAGELIVYVRVD